MNCVEFRGEPERRRTGVAVVGDASNAYVIKRLVKSYDNGRVVANDGIDLEVHAGEIFGLLGPNGAGKSTLVRQMVGLMRQDAGSIKLFGREVDSHSDWVPRQVSFLPQRPLALLDLTVAEAITFTGKLRGLSAKAAHHQAADLMEELDLTGLSSRLVGRLSGGQHRLVGVAVALVGQLPILVLDEPTNELDPHNRLTVWQKLLKVNRELGATIVLVTHNVMEAERVVQRVALLRAAKIAAVGAPVELKALVDRRVRLELIPRGDLNGLLERLGELGEVVDAGNGRYLVMVDRERVRHAIDHVLETITLERLDDFRVLSPSLEDVYLAVGRQAGPSAGEITDSELAVLHSEEG